MNLISYLKTSWYRFSNLWRFQYRTVWTENLPEKLIKKTIYILGGRKCPFQVVYLCPRNCNRVMYLNISNQHEKSERWKVIEHKNGTLSLYPSIWIKKYKCGCHYWIKKGRIIWCD